MMSILVDKKRILLTFLKTKAKMYVVRANTSLDSMATGASEDVESHQYQQSGRGR